MSTWGAAAFIIERHSEMGIPKELKRIIPTL
jgi:hypothetical protein